jgi:hypothetical protein
MSYGLLAVLAVGVGFFQCGGQHGRPTVPPPEYEEPVPPAPPAPSASNLAEPAPTSPTGASARDAASE